MTNTEKPKKTAADRAVQDLERATRVVTRLENTLAKRRAAAAEAESDLTAARQKRDYLAQHPALPTQPQTPPPGEGADGGTGDDDAA